MQCRINICVNKYIYIYIYTRQYRFLPLAAGIYFACTLCALCTLGAGSLAAAVGGGLGLGWVMAAVYSVVNNGLLYDLWNRPAIVVYNNNSNNNNNNNDMSIL